MFFLSPREEKENPKKVIVTMKIIIIIMLLKMKMKKKEEKEEEKEKEQVKEEEKVEEEEETEEETEEEEAEDFEYVEKEWVPLSVHFGMPLANPKLTKMVCNKIGKFNLFSKENISAHTNNSRLLCNKLLDFIEGRQAKDYKFEVMPGVIPYPTLKLTFDATNGKII